MLRARSLFQRGLTSCNQFSANRLLLSRFSTGHNSSFLNGSNSAYVDEMYHQWSTNPAAVHASWDTYFRTGDYQSPPNLVGDYEGRSNEHAPVSGGAGDDQAASDIARVVQYIRAFQVRGHLRANLDPLQFDGKARYKKQLALHKELHIANYGFSESDLDRQLDLSALRNSVTSPPSGFLSGGKMTLRQIRDRLKEIYCGTIGFEYMHIPDVEKCNWIRDHIESLERTEMTKDERTIILDRLTWADHFERVLAQKYATAKRFGLEGAEAFIPGMKALVDTSADCGVESIVIGMPHRGRLNVLTNVVRKPLEHILSEFDGTLKGMDDTEYSGDVKYHLGLSNDRETKDGKKIHLSLMANPSHLEAVNTCVLGKVRAQQYYDNDAERKKSMGLILHGDAAFSGQGIVYETLGLGDLPDYTTGGTVHIIVNNQIGFTTDPFKSRSSPYCSDVAKSVSAPVFHVNGDDPEAVVRVCQLAAKFRATFNSDVVVDIVAYRKHGHNEIDEPAFTQPLMYDIIRKRPSCLELYVKNLVDTGAFTAAECKAISDKTHTIIEEKFIAAKTFDTPSSDDLDKNWTGIAGQHGEAVHQATGVSDEVLRSVASTVTTVPEGFNMHRRLKGINDKKAQALQEGAGLDWSCGEALAFGTLLAEGHHVRLSGQDVERGTFSHRHAVWHDQKTGDTYTALNHLGGNAEHFSVSNSNLSEYGVLGFELGYSMEDPRSLVMWEAQFGDFANGAQIMIDQFICSQEDKWRRQTGLVMLLPHGYEGMGPEHSSARLERYLQLSDPDLDVLPESDEAQLLTCNWQVINPTTPANIFHALRRQVKRNFRKPLIVMSPKSLLRHPDAKSTLEDMSGDSVFQWVYPDNNPNIVADESVRRLVLSSGKVYYDLNSTRNKQEVNDVALVRLEQLNPFPFHAVRDLMHQYPNAEVVWCQEEPKNQGAWNFVRPAMESAAMLGVDSPRADNWTLKYSGRRPMAASATGYAKTHHREQESLVNDALGI